MLAKRVPKEELPASETEQITLQTVYSLSQLPTELIERLRAGEPEASFDERIRRDWAQEEATTARSPDMQIMTPDEFERIRQQFEELHECERDKMVEKATELWCFNHQQNAEDCVDEAFTRLWKLMVRCRQAPPSPLGWLYTTARRVEIDRAKSAFVRNGTAETMDEIASVEPGPEAALHGQELLQEMYREIEALPPDYRLAFLGKYVDRYSYTRIGQEMGRTPRAVQQILHRAREILRHRLAHHAPIARTS